MAAEELTCQELVELVTDYLEGALPTEDRRRFEQHLAACDGCTTYLNQIQKTVQLVRTLNENHLEPHVRDALLTAFRDWKKKP
jgi:anti-sigma factor RsiW